MFCKQEPVPVTKNQQIGTKASINPPTSRMHAHIGFFTLKLGQFGRFSGLLLVSYDFLCAFIGWNGLIAHFFINSFVVFNEFDFNMQNYSWTLLQPDLKFFVGNGSGRVRTPMQTLGCSKSVEEDFYLTSRYNESPLINHSSRHTNLWLIPFTGT